MRSRILIIIFNAFSAEQKIQPKIEDKNYDISATKQDMILKFQYDAPQ